MKTPDPFTYYYQAYGLRIQSEFAIAELVPVKAGPSDVSIQLGNVDEFSIRAESDEGITRSRYGVTAHASRSAVVFNWKGVGAALVRNGREVTIDPSDGIDTADLAPYINGSILAVLLHQRGFAVLHASAVMMDGKAVAFLGEKGAGKSTFAAFLQSRGHAMVTDDLVPIMFVNGQACVTPGFPRIRLWPDSLGPIGVDSRTLPMVNSFVKKLSFRPDAFSNVPLELGRIYLLEQDDGILLEKLTVREAFIEIIRNCYLGCYVDATGHTASHFRNCSELANSVPVYRLKRPHDFSALPEVSLMVENHSSESAMFPVAS